MISIEKLAKTIDHSLLHPTMTDTDLIEGCELAKKYNVASVCVKPYQVKKAAELLSGTDVLICSVIGFPHGNSTISVKVFETKKAIDEGATEIDMVVNIGKVLSEDWQYIDDEIKAISTETKSNKAILKVIFENDFLPLDKYKIKLCEICNKYMVEFVKTSTGYGFVKQPAGSYNYKGATEHDIKLMRKHAAPGIQIKAAGGIRTLEDALNAMEWGASRIGATATAAILNQLSFNPKL
jgi:deoxyribose-phosphate aldolase